MTLFNSTSTINIPGNARDIRVVVAGARGSSGQTGYNSGSGGNGTVGTFFFPNFQARTLTLHLDNNGGNGGGGGSRTYSYTVPQTCTGTATSTISAVWDLYNSGNNARMIVTGTGSASIGIQCEVNDDPGTSGTCFSNFSCNGINFSFPSDGSTNNTKFATFSAGTYNASISGLQKPIQLQNSSKQLSLRDAGGDDENGSFTITGITQNTYSFTFDCSYTATGYYYGGSGGSGGRSASVFDSLTGSYVIVAAGGGGGGAGDFFTGPGNGTGGSGGNGSSGGSWSAGSPSPSNGGSGTTSSLGGGGGGGGGSSGGSGGGARSGGSGGGSVYRSSVVTFSGSSSNSGTAYIDVQFTLVFPVINTFTANKSSMINNGVDSVTLSWTTTDANTATITPLGGSPISVAVDGSLVVSPTSTTTYTLTGYGPGGTTITSSIVITVYQPPVITLSLDRNPIIIGETTTLRWATIGDANTITWTSGGIINGNLNSFSAVTPADTITYSATVSGLGGTDSDSITLIVYQLPTVSINVPTSLLYGQQGIITYQSTYSNVSLTVTPSYLYDFDGLVTGSVVTLTKPTSAQKNVGVTSVSGSFATAIPYNSKGPRTATYLISAVGSGGSVQSSKTVSIIIDETPNNVIIPETEDVIKLQDPVVTPDTTITSEIVEVVDIDIPVEIKSNFPIQVNINQDNTWRNLRQIT